MMVAVGIDFSDSFQPRATKQAKIHQRLMMPPPLAATQQQYLSRSQFLSVATFGALLVGSSLTAPPSSFAMEDAVSPTSLQGCPSQTKGPFNCIATASVKQVDQYAPPWTFQCSADEALARLKGVVQSDSSMQLLEEAPRYLKVKAIRGLSTDELEFLVNDKDNVVTFRSAETGEPSVSDFGANRSRLDSIRKKGNVFGVMGEGLTADSFEGGRGSGPLGQLKAFYGLQSGEGFEDVFEE
jgi:uncharacterized protein (DUF1499 family)